MKKIFLSFLIIFSMLFISVFSKDILAASYYEGKRMTIIVGYAPGGGYDRMARLFAKNLPKYISGKPSIIIENMEGADSLIAANHIYRIAKPDGLTIGAVNRGLPFAQLLKAEGVRFDLTKFSWIGSAAVEAIVLALRSDLPFKTFNDIQNSKSPIMLGATGPASSGAQFPLLLKEYLGVNLKIITYPSSSDVMLAIERKEVDGRGASYSSVKASIDRGGLRAFIRGRVFESGIENLPVDEDICTNKKGKALMAMRSAPDRIGRPFIAPPGTPSDVMNILRDAFAKTAKDPELQAEAKKLGMEAEYVSGDECLKVLNYLFSQPEDIVKEFSIYVKF